MGKLLVVDDEVNTCDTLKDILGRQHTVFTANSAQEGLDILAKEKPEMILSDIKMPNMTGVEMLAKIREIDKDVVVVFITGYGALDTAQEAMNLDAFDYISKPFELELIKSVVKEGLEARAKR